MWRWLLFLLASGQGYYLPISHEAAPFLQLWDGRPVDWSSGPVGALMDTSLAVRASARGLHFYEHEVYPKTEGRPCRRSPSALCVVDNTSIIFPETAAPRFSLRGGGPFDCGSKSSRRVLVPDPGVYDLSSCDLVYAQADVIWSGGMVYVDSKLNVFDWVYVLTGLATLVLVISLGQNIARIMGDRLAAPQPLLTECVCLGLVGLLMSVNDPWRVWVAQHDRTMAVTTCVYIFMYLTRHAFDLVMDRYVHTFNVITATLMLVTARLYLSFETPYATIFLVLLLTRFFHKLESATMTPIERFTLAMDALYAALQYRLCYRPSFWDPQCAALYGSAVIAACSAIGALTSQQIRAKALPKSNDVDEGGKPPVGNNHAQFAAFRADGGQAGHNALRLQFIH
jgi:hypothetical protein